MSLCISVQPFFNIGLDSLAQVQPESGKTRAEWYQVMLQDSEQLLRNAIIQKLKITSDEFVYFQQQAQESILQTEQEIKEQAQDIRGTWIANYTTCSMYKADGSVEQQKLHAKSEYIQFDVTDEKIAKVTSMLQEFGYTGKIVMLEPEDNESLIAYQSVISIRPDLFLYDTADQAFRLRHEVSHIKNQDILFERTIKSYVQSLIRKDFNPQMHTKAEDVFDHKKLQEKGISLDDIDQAQDLLMDIWWNFHEYRADLESLLAMKYCKDFQEKIKDVSQCDGYPLNYDYKTMYTEDTPIDYIQDFLDGLCNDSTAP